jgi:hypothetical protein
MIKKFFSLIILLVISILGQQFIAGTIWPINLLLISTIFLVLNSEGWGFFPLVVLLGLVSDFLSGTNGESFFALLLTAIAIKLLLDKISLANPLNPALLIIFALSINWLLYFIAGQIFNLFRDNNLNIIGHVGIKFIFLYFIFNFLITYGLFRLFKYRKIIRNYGSSI